MQPVGGIKQPKKEVLERKAIGESTGDKTLHTGCLVGCLLGRMRGRGGGSVHTISYCGR
jgi:hypothetical protein